jgi:hypothetical protein
MIVVDGSTDDRKTQAAFYISKKIGISEDEFIETIKKGDALTNKFIKTYNQ